MADSDERRRTRGALPLSALVGRVIGPVAKRRGFATADLIAAWPEIVGARFADCTRPDKIVWPRGEANVDMPGVLTLKVDGPRAVLVQHELGQILERVNAFLGYGAVGQVRHRAGARGAAGETGRARRNGDRRPGRAAACGRDRLCGKPGIARTRSTGLAAACWRASKRDWTGPRNAVIRRSIRPPIAAPCPF